MKSMTRLILDFCPKTSLSCKDNQSNIYIGTETERNGAVEYLWLWVIHTLITLAWLSSLSSLISLNAVLFMPSAASALLPILILKYKVNCINCMPKHVSEKSGHDVLTFLTATIVSLSSRSLALYTVAN